jgi:hypothetical protein
MKLTTGFHLVPRLRTRGAVPPHPNTSSSLGDLSTGASLPFTVTSVACDMKFETEETDQVVANFEAFSAVAV